MTNSFDPDWAAGIVRRVVQRKIGLFSAWPEWEMDDLVQEGVLAALKAHQTFDPAKAKYSTWIYRTVSCRIIDLWRVRGRRADREIRTARSESVMDGEAGGDVEWLGQTYEMIRQQVKPSPQSGRGRPPRFTAAQTLALAALRLRLGLSLRQFERLLWINPDYLRAIGVGGKPPSYRTYGRSGQVVTKIKNNFGKN